MKKTLFRGLLGAALTILVCLPAASRGKGPKKTCEFTDADFRTEKILEALPIRATFLDEVSWDIPHQNWGVKEWDADFKAMKQMGINTVVLIRAGLGSWIAAPFDCLLRTGKVKYPPVDLVEMFLALSDKYGMDFWFGTYDSCYHWHVGEYEKEIELNMQLIDEVWAKYGHHKSFRGWYLSQEISRRTRNVSKIYAAMGRHAKEISGGLKTMISPYIHGVKTDQVMAGDKAITVEEHRRGHPRFPGRTGRLRRTLRLPGGQPRAGRTLRHGVLDQRRIVRPRHAHPFPADQMGEIPLQARRRTARRDAECHHVRILALHEPQFVLHPSGTPLQPLYGIHELSPTQKIKNLP